MVERPQKCFYVFKTDCKYEYGKGKDIGFKKECSEFSTTKVCMNKNISFPGGNQLC